MRGQCGIAVVAATLVAGTSIPTAPDVVSAPRVYGVNGASAPHDRRKYASATGTTVSQAPHPMRAKPRREVELSLALSTAAIPEAGQLPRSIFRNRNPTTVSRAGKSDSLTQGRGSGQQPPQQRHHAAADQTETSAITSALPVSLSTPSSPRSRQASAGPTSAWTSKAARNRAELRYEYRARKSKSLERAVAFAVPSCVGDGCSRPSEANAPVARRSETTSVLLNCRGGGLWFRNNEPYDEFPEDFDYDPMDFDLEDDDGEDDANGISSSSSSSNGNTWNRNPSYLSEETDDPDFSTELEAQAATGNPKPSQMSLSSLPMAKDGEEERMDGTDGAGGNDRLPSAKGNSAEKMPASRGEQRGGEVQSAAESTTVSSLPERPPSIWKSLRNASGKGASDVNGQMSDPASIVGLVLGTLAGAVGLRLWEGFLQHRAMGNRKASEAERVEGQRTTERISEQQARVQALEDQLSYLEEDRRRISAAAKEARAMRRHDERQLKEYVQTLEAHVDQLSRHKQESDGAIVHSVRSETAKALETAHEVHQAAVTAIAYELEQAQSELDTSRESLEFTLQAKASAEQEKTAADALLRKEQGRTGALADEVERLREASVALTQRLSEAVAKAERAVRDERQAIAAQAEAEEAREAAAAAAAVAAEREEEGERHRKEMEHSLAEEKNRLRNQMETRLATMRAGLKRRLREVRAEQTLSRNTTNPSVSPSAATNR